MFTPIASGSRSPGLNAQYSTTFQTPLHTAISSGNWTAVEELLSKSLSLEAWTSALSAACQNPECPPFIKQAFLACEVADLRQALDAAVEHGDTVLAREAIKRDGSPEPRQFQPVRNSAGALLRNEYRRRLLYPENADNTRYTELDRALIAGDYDHAADLLKRFSPAAEEIRDVWGRAVGEGAIDIQRALLILGRVDEDRRFRLREGEGRVTDPNIRKVMKQVPYFSPRRPTLRNLNGRVPNVVCTHLVHHRHAVQAATKKKFDYLDVQNAETIRARVTISEQEILNTINLASETHLVENRRFGAFIAKQLKAMNVGENRQIAIYSTNHAMSLELSVKGNDEGEKVYVAKVFDPNVSTTAVRVGTAGLEIFEGQDLAMYVGDDYIGHYFGKRENVSLMLVRPPEDELVVHFNAHAKVKVPDDRKLTSGLEDIEISPHIIYHLLVHGFSADIRALTGLIKKQPVPVKLSWLTAKNKDGLPGLIAAMQHGHAAAVREFAAVVCDLDLEPEQCMELLGATGANGAHGLYMAMQEGHAEVVRAFIDMVARLNLSPAQRMELVEARSSDGFPGLHIAMQNGHSDVLREVGAALSALNLSLEQIMTLLAASNNDGVPGLFAAMEHGHTGVVQVCGEVLSRLNIPLAQRSELLAAVDQHQISGLAIALSNGHDETIRAFGAILRDFTEEQRTALLATPTNHGTYGLRMAVQRHRADAIRTFAELLRTYPVPPASLAAMLTDAAVPLFMSFSVYVSRADARATVDAYIDLCDEHVLQLSKAQRKILLRKLHQSHARRVEVFKLGIWRNFPDYEMLKRNNSEFHIRFKALKRRIHTGRDQ